MFDSILFRRQSEVPSQPPIDIGSVVEALLFYRSTHVIVDRSTLTILLNGIGENNLLELISNDLLRVTYIETWNGVRTETIATGLQVHDPVVFSSPQHRFPDVLRKTCIGLLGKAGRGRRLAQRLEKHIHVAHHDPIITAGTREVFLKPQYLESAAQVALLQLVPGVDTTGIRFVAHSSGDRFLVDTNIDWARLNQQYHKYVSVQHSTLTPAYLLSCVFNVECDLYFASAYSSELSTSLMNSRLMTERVNYLVQRRAKSQDTLNHFQVAVFDEAKSVREAINGGAVSVTDLMPIIKRSARFKKWVNGKPYDADLLSEYYREVTAESIVDKLPAKSSRWAFFTGAGMALDTFATGGLGTAAGLALGALDTFVLDSILRGWKPNQFIEEDLGRVLRSKIQT